MTGLDKFELLTEITRLLRKYGPETFADLASFLRKPDEIAHLTSLLEVGSKAGRKAHVVKKAQRKTPGLSGFLSELEMKEPDKASQLSPFVRALQAKMIFPSLRELRDFASDNGFRQVNGTSRERALLPLVKDIAARPMEDLTKILGEINVVNPQGDRSLDGWTGVILKKDRT